MSFDSILFFNETISNQQLLSDFNSVLCHSYYFKANNISQKTMFRSLIFVCPAAFVVARPNRFVVYYDRKDNSYDFEGNPMMTPNGQPIRNQKDYNDFLESVKRGGLDTVDHEKRKSTQQKKQGNLRSAFNVPTGDDVSKQIVFSNFVRNGI